MSDLAASRSKKFPQFQEETEVRIEFHTKRYYHGCIKALVTTKGQVTIPKPLREQFGIEPGAEVDFVAMEDGIRLRKVVNRVQHHAVLGCLKDELASHSTTEWLDELRGPVELPPPARRHQPKKGKPK